MPTWVTGGRLRCFVDGVEVEAVEVTITQEVERVTTMDGGPDPYWQHSDAAGHFHAYDFTGKTPTLVEHTTEASWCETCQDTHGETFLICRLCGEKVVPRRKAGPGHFDVPGPREARLLVAGEVSEDEHSIYLPDQRLFGVMRPYGSSASSHSGITSHLSGWLEERLSA